MVNVQNVQVFDMYLLFQIKGILLSPLLLIKDGNFVYEVYVCFIRS